MSLREEQAQWIEENSGDREKDESKSDAIRTLMGCHEELQEEVMELQQENERLYREKQMILEQRDENTELVKYVEDKLSYREAGLGTRIKWWLFGKDSK